MGIGCRKARFGVRVGGRRSLRGWERGSWLRGGGFRDVVVEGKECLEMGSGTSKFGFSRSTIYGRWDVRSSRSRRSLERGSRAWKA